MKGGEGEGGPPPPKHIQTFFITPGAKGKLVRSRKRIALFTAFLQSESCTDPIKRVRLSFSCAVFCVATSCRFAAQVSLLEAALTAL